MSFFPEIISSIFTTSVTPSRWRVSTLICAIIFRHWRGEVDVFRESWKISRLFWLCSCGLTTVLEFIKTAIVPTIRGSRHPVLSLISFNCAFGHSAITMWYWHFHRVCDKLLSSIFGLLWFGLRLVSLPHYTKGGLIFRINAFAFLYPQVKLVVAYVKNKARCNGVCSALLFIKCRNYLRPAVMIAIW